MGAAFGVAPTKEAAAECLGLPLVPGGPSLEPVEEGDWEDWEVEADVEEEADRFVVVDADRVEDEEVEEAVEEAADEFEETEEERETKEGRSRGEGDGLGVVVVEEEDDEEDGVESVVGKGRDRDGMTAGGSIRPELGLRPTEEDGFLDEGEANAPIPSPLRAMNGESRSSLSGFSLPPVVDAF
jgi:hypothetical protein